MPETLNEEKNLPIVSLINVMDAASEVQAILNASYELYATIRDGDDNLTTDTIAVIMRVLNEKAEELLQEIEQTADKLRAAVA
ncbi:MAG: hypothetical protein AB1556_07535 [Bacillota bacterium]